MCAGCEQSHTNDTLVKYVYKYMSKPLNLEDFREMLLVEIPGRSSKPGK